MNKRNLLTDVILNVANITFAPESGTDWAQNDNVAFSGQLQEALIFGVKNFAVMDTLIQEEYSITGTRNYEDPATADVSEVVLLGGVHVAPAEVTLFGEVTNNLRHGLDDVVYATFEAKADGATVFYKGSRGAMLAYLLQIQNSGTERIHTLYNWSFATKVSNSSIFDDVYGANGPVELVKAHETLANAIAETKL